MDLQTAASADGLEPNFRAVLSQLGAKAAIVLDLAERTFYSTDISGRSAVADAVVRVGDVETLCEVARVCYDHNYIVIPRGGGFSYTGGYTPTAPRSVIIDLRPMNRIIEINTEDMYVVVEAGCTWERLYEALKAKGVRTPYFGPMSGFRATVGGALSQGSFFLGSSQNGPVSDSVLGLEVVLADGRLLKTGSGASSETPDFFRQYGPDLTGLFLSDTGAMGLKTKVVLRLIPYPSHQAYASFAFSSHADAVAAVSAVGRTGWAAECYCWDPYFVELIAAASTGTREDLRFLLNVVKAGAGLFDGLAAASRIALAGRRVFSGDTWLMHVVIDDASAAGAAGRLKQVRALVRQVGATEVSPSAPRALRGTPFTDFNTPARRSPRRNLPTHGLCPHSRAPALADDIYRFLAEHQADMALHGIRCGVIFFAVGGQAIAIEPLMYWEDAEQFLHNRVEETSDLEGLAAHTDRPAATKLALSLREGIKALFRRHGCVHLQIGRAYPWRETREAAALGLLTAMKDSVDPKRLMNRGALGFGGPGL